MESKEKRTCSGERTARHSSSDFCTGYVSLELAFDDDDPPMIDDELNEVYGLVITGVDTIAIERGVRCVGRKRGLRMEL